MQGYRRQGGWAFVVILIALAIVAFLSREALLSYFGIATQATRSSDTRLPPAARDIPDSSASTATPRAPVERARAVEDVVRKQADDAARRIDGAAR